MPNQQQLDLLNMGVTGWNEWRQAHPDEPIDLSGANLSGVDLGGCDLSKANLIETNFRGSNLSGADLMEAHLQEAILVRANLQGTLLNKAHLEKAYLYRACLKDAVLIGAILDEADLERADMAGALLYEAHLKGAYLYAAILKGAKLRGAHLEGADLHEGHLEGADLQKAILGGNETLPLTNLRNVFFDEATNLRDITLGNLEHGFVRLADIHWSDVNLAVISWGPVTMLGDERDAHQCRQNGESWKVQLNMLYQAIRANHQLVAILQDQAMLEEADYFGYRAQVLHRKVLQLQLLMQLQKTWIWKLGVGIGLAIVGLWRWFQTTGVWRAMVQVGHGIYNVWRWFQTTGVWRAMVKIGHGIYRLCQWILELGSVLRKGVSLIFAMFLGLLAGYGYKPERTFFWYLLVVFGFAEVFFLFYHPQTFSDALILSLTSFHGRGFFPGALGGDPHLEPAAPVAVVEAIVGLMIEISFVATFTRRFFGK